MNFFIKKNSTLPELIFPISQRTMEYYNLTSEMFENVAVTFSMINQETGLYVIANVAANLITEIPKVDYPDVKLYSLGYKFRLCDTKNSGNFLAEWKLDFMGENSCGKITLPDGEDVNVIIGDSITKTSVV